MSALLLDVRPASSTVPVFAAGVGRTHPRGHGFHVLSRIARTHASDDEYAPRHRRDVSWDLVVHDALAS
jgi:hypothetical protein